MVDRGEIKSVTTYLEPLGLYPDGSFALTRVFDIVIQPVQAVEYISLKTSINKDGNLEVKESTE
jgi:hypothetical protein